MNDLSDMTDLSWTQTSRAMASKHLDRQQGNYVPWWELVKQYNRETLTKGKFIDRRAMGLRSNPTVFIGC